MSLTQDIKEFGLDLGYSKVGIAPADDFPDYAADLQRRQDMYDWYMAGAFQPILGTRPKTVMPTAKSIVVAVLDCAKEAFPEHLLGKVGRLYLSRAYLSPRHRLAGARRQLLRDFLEQNKMQVATRLIVPERMSAARAGATNYGKNTFAYLQDSHSFILITTFVVDAELEYDKPTVVVDCPPNCTACIDACPTAALYEPLKMNPKKCIAFNTFMAMDNVIPGLSGFVPFEIREKMGSWIHGCDICQEACPRNQPRLKAKLPRNEFLELIAADFDLRKVLNLTEDYYRRRIFPIMYNYIREKKYFQRNAAIALGNTRDSAFVPDLAQALIDPEPMVRGYAAWGLGRIGGQRAKQVLQSALARETDGFVRKEIESALGMA